MVVSEDFAKYNERVIGGGIKLDFELEGEAVKVPLKLSYYFLVLINSTFDL